MKSKIFVDGDCIVCDTEVAHYKRMAPEAFELVDISSPDFHAQDFGITLAEFQKNLHVATPEGKFLTGVDAFAHIWSRIDRYRIATQIVNLPVVNPIAKLGYKAFTYVRPFLPRRS